jgi:hypothetical protein
VALTAFYGIIQAIEVITKCMTAWRRNRDDLPPHQGHDRLAYAYAYAAQQSIRWGCFLEGSLAKEWLPVYRHITYDHSVHDEWLQYSCTASFVSCGGWLFECGNTAMDGNILVKIVLKIGFSDRHSTAKFMTPWSKEVPQFVPSIGICLQRPLRIG